MLKRLLMLIAATDGATSVDGLARAMDIPRTLVERLMADLVRSGHLRLARGDCARASCSHCPMQSDCEPTTAMVLWELTEKGRGALAEASV